MYTIRNMSMVGIAVSALVVAHLVGGCGSRGGGTSLSGTYEARHPEEGGMSLRFGDGNKVTVTVYDPPNENMTAEGEYHVKGERITVRVPTSKDPLVLTQRGDELEMAMPGGAGSVNFTKK